MSNLNRRFLSATPPIKPGTFVAYEKTILLLQNYFTHGGFLGGSVDRPMITGYVDHVALRL